jgi:DNA-directed RNA polymerase I subunit RPA1
MIHSFYEIYGSEKAGELLTSLGRIFTMYLQIHGFTCGTDDMMLTP